MNALVAQAKTNSDATTLVFVAGDGSSSEVSIDEITACDQCILSFRNQGGFSTVFPGCSSKLQVKGVIEIRVK